MLNGWALLLCNALIWHMTNGSFRGPGRGSEPPPLLKGVLLTLSNTFLKKETYPFGRGVWAPPGTPGRAVGHVNSNNANGWFRSQASAGLFIWSSSGNSFYLNVIWFELYSTSHVTWEVYFVRNIFWIFCLKSLTNNCIFNSIKEGYKETEKWLKNLHCFY